MMDLSDADTEELLTGVEPLSNFSSFHSSPRTSPTPTQHSTKHAEHSKEKLHSSPLLSPHHTKSDHLGPKGAKSLPTTPFGREAANEIASRLLASIHQSPELEPKSRSLTELHSTSPNRIRKQLFAEGEHHRPRSPVSRRVPPTSRSRSYSPLRSAESGPQSSAGQELIDLIRIPSPVLGGRSPPRDGLRVVDRSKSRSALLRSPIKETMFENDLSVIARPSDPSILPYKDMHLPRPKSPQSNRVMSSSRSPQGRERSPIKPRVKPLNEQPRFDDGELHYQSSVSAAESVIKPNAEYISKLTNRPYRFGPGQGQTKATGTNNTVQDHSTGQDTVGHVSRIDRHRDWLSERNPERRRSPQRHEASTRSPDRTERNEVSPVTRYARKGLDATTRGNQHTTSHHVNTSGVNDSVQQMQDVRDHLRSMMKTSSEFLGGDEKSDEVHDLFGREGLIHRTGDKSYSDISPHSSAGGISYPSRVWGSLSSSTLGNNSTMFSENQILKDCLEKERYRRKHCEKQIQQLQSKMLELQQQVAVAVSTDKKKDIMIEQLDKTLAKVVEGWKKKESEKDEYIDKLTRDKDDVIAAHSKQQQMLHQFEIDLRQAVEDLTREKERCRKVEQDSQMEIERHSRENSKLVQSLEAERDRARRACTEQDRALEGREHMEQQLHQLQDTLNHERANWMRREQNLVTKLDELAESQQTIFQTEKDKTEELSRRAKEAQNQAKALQRENQELKIQSDNVLRERDHLKVEVGLLEAKMESARRKLEAELQSQLEREVSDKLATAHEHMSRSEANMRENHRKHITEVTDRHSRELEDQLRQFHDEIKRKEDKFREQIEAYEDRITTSKNEVNELRIAKNKLENQRQEVTSKLASLLNLQAGEAQPSHHVVSPGQDSVQSGQRTSRLSYFSAPGSGIAGNSPGKDSQAGYSLHSSGRVLGQLTHRSDLQPKHIDQQVMYAMQAAPQVNQITMDSFPKKSADAPNQKIDPVTSFNAQYDQRSSSGYYSQVPNPHQSHHTQQQRDFREMKLSHLTQQRVQNGAIDTPTFPADQPPVYSQTPSYEYQTQHQGVPNQPLSRPGQTDPSSNNQHMVPIGQTVPTITQFGVGHIRPGPTTHVPPMPSIPHHGPQQAAPMQYGGLEWPTHNVTAVNSFSPLREDEDVASNIDIISELNDPSQLHNSTYLSTGPLDNTVTSSDVYGGMTEKFTQHEDRQTELQHYVKLLLNRSPGTPLADVDQDTSRNPAVSSLPSQPRQQPTAGPKTLPQGSQPYAISKSTVSNSAKNWTKPNQPISAGGVSGTALSTEQMDEISRLMDVYKNDDGNARKFGDVSNEPMRLSQSVPSSVAKGGAPKARKNLDYRYEVPTRLSRGDELGSQSNTARETRSATIKPSNNRKTDRKGGAVKQSGRLSQAKIWK